MKRLSDAMYTYKWLLPTALMPLVQRIDYKLGYPGDHQGVSLHVASPAAPEMGPGRGAWAFRPGCLGVPTLPPDIRQYRLLTKLSFEAETTQSATAARHFSEILMCAKEERAAKIF